MAEGVLTFFLSLGPPSLSAKAKMDMAQIKMGGGSSQFKFAVLSKIVRHMRHRHMEGEDMPLKLDEMLDETNQVLSRLENPREVEGGSV